MKPIKIRALRTIRLPGEPARWMKSGETKSVPPQFARDKVALGHAQLVDPKAGQAGVKPEAQDT